MSFPLFKDITKNTNDFLKKGFPTTEKFGFRVEFDTTSSSGIQFTPHLQQTLDKNIEGELKTKFFCKDHQFITTGNLKEDVSFEVSPSKHSSKGLKWTAHLSSNLNDFSDKAKGKLTLEIKSDYATSTISGEHPFKHSNLLKSDDSKVLLNSVFGSKEKGVSAGFDTEFSVSSLQLKNVNTAIAFNKGDIDISLFSKKKVGGSTSVGSNFLQKLTSDKWADAQVGGELSFDLNDKTHSYILAAGFKPSDPSTFKARFDSKGLLGFVYTEKWSGPLSVTFGSDWNINGAANPFTYGIKLAFK